MTRNFEATLEKTPAQALPAKMAAFAARQIAPRTELCGSDDFPLDLWLEMGRNGLLAPSVEARFGGVDGDNTTLLHTGYELVRAGRCLGFAMSWLGHALVAGELIAKFAGDGQKAAYLPVMTAGDLRVAVAISEPNAGAHPKHLTSRAVRNGSTFVLTGEKAFVTNGPIADLFLIFAITADDGGRKKFSAFLVPKGTPGLMLLPTKRLDFLRPSLHCGLKLDDCRVPESALFGPEGQAFETISMPFRDREDALLMGPLLGGLEILARALAQGPAVDEDDEALGEELGELAASLAGLHAIAGRAAARLDGGRMGDTDFPGLSISFRHIMRRFLERADELRPRCGAANDPVLDVLSRDLAKTGDIARYANRIKQRKLSRTLLPFP